MTRGGRQEPGNAATGSRGRSLGLLATAVLVLVTSSCTVTLELGHASMELLSGVLGAMVWLLANISYVNFRRYARRGFKRFVAFWLGFPVTLTTMFVVPEGRPELTPPDDEDESERILAEWREHEAAMLPPAAEIAATNDSEDHVE